MKNLKLKRLVAVALVAMTIETITPIGASASWKQDSTETTANLSNGVGRDSSNGNSGTSHAAISQAIIDAKYKKDTKITTSVIKNTDGTTTIKPILSFTPGTYTESITAIGKTYLVTKDIYITFNGKDAYISGNYKDGYKIDAGVTGKVEIVASISIYDSANGKLYYANTTPSTVAIPAK